MKKLYLIQISLFVMMLYIITGVMNAQPAELLVHYKLDDASGVTAADASGNGNDGTISGTPKWVDGTIDGAFEFSGTEAVTLPPTLGLTSDMGSVALWMNCDVPSSIFTMFWAGDNTTGGGFGAENEIHIHLEQGDGGQYWMGGELSFFVIANPNTFLFSDPDKGTDPATTPVNPILLGDKAWHHVAASWGNGLVKLYIDGNKISEAAYVSTSYALTNIYLGQMANGGRTYTGILDDVRLYTGILTDIEVNDLFNKITATRDIKNSNKLSFYPNPALDILNVNFVSKAGNSADISLLNLVGQEVTNKSVSTVTGVNDVTLSLDGIAAGIYFVRLELDNEVTVEKIRIK